MIAVTDTHPRRPQLSGAGSGVKAWREYAAAVTGTPIASWDTWAREDIIAMLESEGVEQLQGQGEESPGDIPDLSPGEHTPRQGRRPKWMVPTDDGFVPEVELRRGLTG